MDSPVHTLAVPTPGEVGVGVLMKTQKSFTNACFFLKVLVL